MEGAACRGCLTLTPSEAAGWRVEGAACSACLGWVEGGGWVELALACCRMLGMRMKGATQDELLSSELPDRLSPLTGAKGGCCTNDMLDREVYMPYLA